MPATESQLIPEVSGKVAWMSPNLVAGGYFDNQEMLIRVDDTDYNTKLNRAKASLTRAEAEQQHAQFEYRRMQSLVKRNLVSRSQLENSLRAYRVAEASLQDTTANFNQAEQDLARTNSSTFCRIGSIRECGYWSICLKRKPYRNHLCR